MLFFRKICFLLKANTLHGTHSPFVYELLENVVYMPHAYYCFEEFEKEQKKMPFILQIKIAQLAFKLVQHFQLKTIILPEKKNSVFEQYLRLSKTPLPISIEADATIFYYVDALLSATPLPAINNQKENSMIFINRLRQSKESFKRWKEYYSKAENSIALDFFYFGIIVYRPKQKKEYFLLRFKN